MALVELASMLYSLALKIMKIIKGNVAQMGLYFAWRIGHNIRVFIGWICICFCGTLHFLEY
jgi:hypothetical protein